VPTTYAGLIDVHFKAEGCCIVPYNGMQWSQPQLGEC
jgi:hypothetical protein